MICLSSYYIIDDSQSNYTLNFGGNFTCLHFCSFIFIRQLAKHSSKKTMCSSNTPAALMGNVLRHPKAVSSGKADVNTFLDVGISAVYKIYKGGLSPEVYQPLSIVH